MAYEVHSWQSLQNLTDDDLIRLFDDLAPHTHLGVDFYRDEMVRRAYQRATDAALAEAKAAREEAAASRRLAKWNMVMATVAVVVAVAAILVPILT